MQHNHINIHHAKVHDWARVRKIRLLALKSDPDAFGSTFDKEHDQSPSFWQGRLQSNATTLLASIDGQDVGIITIAPHWDDGHSVCFYGVWVAPEARGQGVGDAIIGAAIAVAKDLNVLYIRLEVSDVNAPAIALYARWGFEPSGHVMTLPAPREHITEHERVYAFL